jgi:uncharacterized protein (DUF885 family)
VTRPDPGAGAASAGSAAAAATALARLGEEFYQVVHTADPFTATQLGASGFDALVPDPSRAGSARAASQLAGIERSLGGIDPGLLDDRGRTDHAVLGELARGARSEYEHGLWEANASAAGYVSPQAMLYQSVPRAPLPDAGAVAGYLRRLGQLGGYLDVVARRYAEAAGEGRVPAETGVRQAIALLAGHLRRDVADDVLVTVPLPPGPDGAEARGQIAGIVADQVRPAAARLLACLERDLLPVARPQDRAGIGFVPGGAEGYLAAVRRHTGTGLTPEQIHQLGLDRLAELQAEWAELGRRALGTAGLPEILDRLRGDPALRFARPEQILTLVTGAQRRAEAATADWFGPLGMASCVIEEIDPVEAGSAPLAYYRPPAPGGGRPGAVCVLTAAPGERFSYEYEALTFHEGTPGHHLQLAFAQTLSDLPGYRRFLDAEVCCYVEGWGLYCERLADEMGLYTSDLQRLGMLSFEALRASRLVVDTGMHYYGWSRARAVEFMTRHTATAPANIASEVDRYIAWPGQALAYLTGCRELRRLRELAQRRLGPRFDIRAFHRVVLGSGAVPLSVLSQLVTRWLDGAASA